jgi:beta-phosphoglucomutase-like phosphatase (HAD superfamily)
VDGVERAALFDMDGTLVDTNYLHAVSWREVTYSVGEAMQGTDHQDLDKTPDTVASTTKAVAVNAAHLARSLRAAPYPPS